MTRSEFRDFLGDEMTRLSALEANALYPPNAEDARGFEEAVIEYILHKDFVRRISSDPVFAEVAYEKYGIRDTG